MTDDRLLDRLRELDPATPERIAAASRGTDELRREIEREEVDELAIHRRARRRRVAVAIAAAAVTAALLVPLILLLPLGEDDSSVIGATPSLDMPTPTADPSQSTEPVHPGPLDPIEVAQPARGAAVTSPVTITGTADVFEATVSVRIQDAVNNTIAETFTTATCGTGCRGDFSVEVPYSVDTEQPGVIQVFEMSAEDGSMMNVVRIPVTLLPTADDPVAAAVEGDWTAPDGSTAPSGEPGTPLVLHTLEGAEHCGWTSVTFLHTGWPIGSETGGGDSFRQYVRDPTGLLSSMTAAPFRPSTTLPADAVFTGYHRGDWQLWIAPSDEDRAVYVVNGDPLAQGVVERWSRATDPIRCR